MDFAANPVVSVIVALTLALTAAAVVAPSTGAEQAMPASPVGRIQALYEVVKAELDANGYVYDYVEKDKAFYYDVGIKGAINKASVRISLYEDMIIFFCMPGITVRAENRDLMAELQCRINWNRSFAQMQMNYATGEIGSYGFLLVEEVLPGEDEVSFRRYITVYLMEEFGDALAKVALLGIAPEDALPESFENADARDL